MELIIDIPEEMFQTVKDGNWCGNHIIGEAIRNGTPLPEHHGRLIDADWVKNTLDIYVINEYNGQFIRRNDIDTVPTIIGESESE